MLDFFVRTQTTVLALVVLVALVTPTIARADSFTLAWDRNPESSVVGYYVYIGTASGVYAAPVNVGSATTYTFNSALPGTRYYMTVAAYIAGPVLGPRAAELVTTTSGGPILSNPGNRSSNQGTALTLTLSATDPNNDPITFAALGLPNGLSLNPITGVISGTPTTAGTFTVSVTASDPSAFVTTQLFTWTIVATTTGTPPVSGGAGTNIAPTAVVSASSQTAPLQSAIKAVDTVLSGYPTNSGAEWATLGERAGAWIQLDWAADRAITRVRLTDRPNSADQVTSGTLLFSDGSSIAVAALPNTTSLPLEVTFATKTVRWVRFRVVGVASASLNIGLAEIEVIGSTVSAPPPPDSVPPVLSSGAPSGTLGTGTTQTTVSLTTNENATCRYDTTAGVAYASMSSTFTTTGGTAHSMAVTGLVNGRAYTYFVRCRDAATNATLSDYAIGFSVATASVPTLALVAPNTGVQGVTSVAVTVTGQFTNWVNGVTTANFGVGITATTSVTDATHLTATLSITAAAATGTRTVTVTTGAQVLALGSGFSVTAAPTTTAFTPIRINAGGGSFVDSLGQTWAADKNFSGGRTYTTGNAISGTVDDTLYQSERYGTFSYNLAVPNGTYTVTLKFAEIWHTGAGKRVFSVAMEGQTVLSNLDLVATAGANRALDRTFQVTVADGTLNIAVTTLVDNGKLSALQVVKSN